MEVVCRKCKQPKLVNCTLEQLAKWRGGMLIQRAMPDVSPDQRELLITGICGTCFDEIFAVDEDD